MAICSSMTTNVYCLLTFSHFANTSLLLVGGGEGEIERKDSVLAVISGVLVVAQHQADRRPVLAAGSV